MHILLRLLVGLIILSVICNYFYSLGRKSAFDQSNSKRRKVDSSVVDDEADKEE